MSEHSEFASKSLAVASHTPWDEIGACDHLVQFYEDDAHLIETVSGFAGTGIEAGEAMIVIATPSHRDHLEERLRARGLDMTIARERGQYVSLDAAETLAKFMVAGHPDAQRFSEVIGGVVARATGSYPKVRAFGEMVSLLWADDNGEATVRLEELWNELAQIHPFSLVCAYPIKPFDRDVHARAFASICCAHTHVVPAESYLTQANADERFRAIVRLQQKANALEAEVMERKMVEAALAKQAAELALANEELKRSNAELERFAFVASHDLQEPLRTVSSLTELLVKTYRGRLEPDADEVLSHICSNTERMRRLIQDLLTYSRVGRHRDRSRVALQDVLPEVRDALQSTVRDAEASVHCDDLPAVLGNRSELLQLLQNLVGNALKFTNGNRPEVRIGARSVEGELVFFVQDNGIGISAEYQEKIFVLFQRLHSGYGGTGVGLAICKKIVESHGGRIWVESQPGSGSTFYFTLLPAPDGPSLTPRERSSSAQAN